MRPRPLPALLVAVALAAVACGDAGRPADDATGDVAAEQGTDGAREPATTTPLAADTGEGPLPSATFASLTDPDVEVSTDDWRGTPTVVNFWATWCGFCTEEMPDLQAAHERLGDAVRFVGIDRQDPRDAALAFLAETGVTYDQVASPDGAYFTTVRARGMPTTLFVDADGQVRFRHTGPLDTDRVLALVEEHLGVAA